MAAEGAAHGGMAGWHTCVGPAVPCAPRCPGLLPNPPTLARPPAPAPVAPWPAGWRYTPGCHHWWLTTVTGTPPHPAATLPCLSPCPAACALGLQGHGPRHVLQDPGAVPGTPEPRPGRLWRRGQGNAAERRGAAGDVQARWRKRRREAARGGERRREAARGSERRREAARGGQRRPEAARGSEAETGRGRGLAAPAGRAAG